MWKGRNNVAKSFHLRLRRTTAALCMDGASSRHGGAIRTPSVDLIVPLRFPDQKHHCRYQRARTSRRLPAASRLPCAHLISSIIRRRGGQMTYSTRKEENARCRCVASRIVRMRLQSIFSHTPCTIEMKNNTAPHGRSTRTVDIIPTQNAKQVRSG